ncbi:outer membrane lipoprotein carrier protein LolA [Nocardioides sp. AN3]
MMLSNRGPRWRWLLPILAVVVVTSAGSGVAAISRSAHHTLPARSAAQLLVDVQKARLDGFSGTVVQSASLGLPDLPGVAGDRSSSFSSLVSGSHTLRVWSAGQQQARIALLGQLGESDLVRNGSDVWLWSSHDNTARHFAVPAQGQDHGHKEARTPTGPAMTPQQAADAALQAITPTTMVSTDPNAVVADRAAYQLVLEPRDTATLIGAVKVAIDGATHIPTRVQIFARGAAKPAFETGFTSFDPSKPSSSVFRFNPPPGATVTQGGMGGMGGKGDSSGSAPAHAPDAAPHTVGTGWTTIVKATMPTPGGGAASKEQTPLGSLGSVVKSLPTVSGSWGSGHLLRGTLFSVLVTDDGRVVAGAVAPAQLYAALAAR